MKRHHWIGVAMAAASAVVLAGCAGGSDTSTDGADGTTSAACNVDPKIGGTLVVGRQNETLTINPYVASTWGDGEILNMVFQGPIRTDQTGQTDDIVGGLADEWTVSEDGLSYTFHLREGVLFSNGEPVTVEDIKAAIDREADIEINPNAAANMVGYDSTTILSDSEFRVDLKEPNGAFLYALTSATKVVPSALLEEMGDEFWDNPIGAGPFMVKEFEKGSSITLVRNPHYWEEGVPRLDEVVFNFITDDNARVLALQSGEVSLIDSVPPSQIDAIRAQDDLVLTTAAIPSWVLLSLNHQKDFLADVNVRQALNYAIDREAINEKIYGGVATIPNSILPQQRYDGTPDQVPVYAYDPEKAKELISQSSFPEGFSATLEYPSGNAQFESLALVLQEAWSEIGVDIELRANDAATLFKNLSGGDYELSIPFALAATPLTVPDQFAGLYALSDSGTNGFYTSWNDPAIEEMVREFQRTADDATRAELWPKIQAAFNEQLPAINVLDLPSIGAAVNTLCGVTLTPIGYSTVQYAWLAG